MRLGGMTSVETKSYGFSDRELDAVVKKPHLSPSHAN